MVISGKDSSGDLLELKICAFFKMWLRLKALSILGVLGLGFGVWGLGFRGLGFGVSGLGERLSAGGVWGVV